MHQQPLVNGPVASASDPTMQSAEHAPLYEVAKFTFSDRNTDSEFIVMCRGKRVIIRVFERDLSESPHLKEQYLFFLQVAEEGGELDGQTLEDFYDWVVDPVLPVLRSLPPLDSDPSAKATLQEYLFADTLVYTLGIEAGKLSPTRRETTQEDIDYIGLGISLPDDLCSPWPCFRLSDIEICAESFDEALSRTPRKVIPVDGTLPFFIKLFGPGDTHSTKRELRIYKQISEMASDPEARIPRLHGLVKSDDGRVFGLLLSYINCRNMTLTCAMRPDPPVALRRKWKKQISSTVELLHIAGVVWGDVKADNVLIDDRDDAWVVGFGGRYTEGWVEKELAGTLEGDAQGLSKILKFIGG